MILDDSTVYRQFRGSAHPMSVFVQAFFLCITFFTFAGIVYIGFTIVAVVFHHFAFDRNLQHIPGFVVTSMTLDISSSEDHYDDEEMEAIRAMEKKKELKGGIGFHEKEVGTTIGPTYSKKTLLLSEFLMNERDRKAN